MTGGTSPYAYSLDNQMFVGNSAFLGLAAGLYDVYVKDANECVYSIQAGLIEPAPLLVSIAANNQEGDSSDTLYFTPHYRA